MILLVQIDHYSSKEIVTKILEEYANEREDCYF